MSEAPVLVISVILLLQDLVLSQELVYGLLNEEVVMSPHIKINITEILWKFENDKLAEWDSIETSYFGTFKGRTELHKNGTLGIKNITFQDNGLYTLSILSGEIHDKIFNLTVLKPVSKPHVNYSFNESICNLTCVGDEDIGYSWNINGKDQLDMKTNPLTFSKDTDLDTVYICKVKNPKSEEESDPFVVRKCFPAGGRTHFAIIFPLLIFVLLLLCGFLYRKFHNKRSKDASPGPDKHEEEVLVLTVGSEVHKENNTHDEVETSPSPSAEQEDGNALSEDASPGPDKHEEEVLVLTVGSEVHKENNTHDEVETSPSPSAEQEDGNALSEETSPSPCAEQESGDAVSEAKDQNCEEQEGGTNPDGGETEDT
ncbi:lymphocyte function-associated antigen 3 isoform X2 [Amia ocellicauda]|uniref:lymphocyte function-associated antigen 3 isoform X2 n=1 Tax=Amia ocellicauda TaxID=2972642 RepID=UPI003464A82F